MPAYARSEIVDDATVGVYHCISRCVRRAFLCGDDPFTGRNCDHRKRWIQDRLEELAGIFAFDVLGFAILSNHFHLVLRNRPDVAGSWSDEEVARRWYRLHPKRRDDDGTAAEPEPSELAAMLADPEWIAARRRRLASLSWFMRSLCEPIARRANAEDQATGKFFESRYKSQALTDETAVLACSVYVDLNPIRACLADTPENSQFTAAFERIAAMRQTVAAPPVDPAMAAAASGTRDAWLSPVADGDVRLDPRTTCATHSAHRASNRGFLPMTLDEYLELLDWTGRQIRIGKRGSIPDHLAPILARLNVNSERWMTTIEQFGRMFRRAIGRVSSLAALAASRGRHWYQGVGTSRLVFG